MAPTMRLRGCQVSTVPETAAYAWALPHVMQPGLVCCDHASPWIVSDMLHEDLNILLWPD